MKEAREREKAMTGERNKEKKEKNDEKKLPASFVLSSSCYF